MLNLPSSLNDKFADGVTTLAWAWRLRLADGSVLGFTEHDHDLVHAGLTYRANTARLEGAVETEAGFAGGSAAFAGLLDDPSIEETEIASGRFDDAEVALLRLDWSDPDVAIPVFSGRLGEIRRGEAGFVAELRGPGAALERMIGRTISRRCDAELGDARCRVDLSAPALNTSGAVSDILSARRFVAGALGVADAALQGGVLTWTSGPNAFARARILEHRAGETEAVLELAEPPAASVAIGDAFTARAGCDKRWTTCRDRFANLMNFQGFPMIPGDDWALAPIREGDRADGGSIWTEPDA